MIPDEIHVITYRTLTSCLRAYNPNQKRFDKPASSDEELTAPRKRISREEYLRLQRKRRCWGFANWAKDEVHLWVGRRATMEDVAALIAHEIAHLIKPRHKTYVKDEQRAARYDSVTCAAVSSATAILKDRGVGRFIVSRSGEG